MAGERAAEALEEQGEGAPPNDAPRSARTAVRWTAPAWPELTAARLDAFDEERRTARLRAGGASVEAAVDPAVSASVLRTALARGERVIVEADRGGFTVVGALRTAATPGVDEADEFRIKASRVTVDAAHEISLVSGAATLVLRAVGQVETLAENIVSRASSVHKIIGRMIRLN
ncbi:hypothetical protein WMF30_19080 [Sorangium sp. So ce134]